VVDVNEALAEFTIYLFEDETANSAPQPIVLQAISPCAPIALISVHTDLFPRPFHNTEQPGARTLPSGFCYS